MLILYTAQSCSTAGEGISTALYCKHRSYSPGELQHSTAANFFSILVNIKDFVTEIVK